MSDHDHAAHDEDDNDMASSPPSSEKIAVSELEAGHNGVDSDLAKRVLRKIDLRIIPLLFVTYMLNFMDKTILSSASVFGLRDDTVRLPSRSAESPLRTQYSYYLSRRV